MTLRWARVPFECTPCSRPDPRPCGRQARCVHVKLRCKLHCIGTSQVDRDIPSDELEEKLLNETPDLPAVIDTGATNCRIPEIMSQLGLFTATDRTCNTEVVGNLEDKVPAEVYFAHILILPPRLGYRSLKPIILRDVRFVVPVSPNARTVLVGMSALARLDLHLDRLGRQATLIQRRPVPRA